MYNYITIKLILDSMRNEVKDRETFLLKLRDLTRIKRINIAIESINKEIISINNFIENENYDCFEKEELLVIKEELINILSNR